MFENITNPPVAHGAALFTAVLKHVAADFRVHEVLSIDFSGEGEHLYLQVEKTSMNTDEVVEKLHTLFSVGSADVGFCGLKDRHSVSTQWFSVRTPLTAELFVNHALEYNEAQVAQWGEADSQLKSMRLIRGERHSRKLRRGAHRCNEFDITLRDIEALPVDGASATASAAHSATHSATDNGSNSTYGHDALSVAVAARIDTIKRLGFPAYIGPQRFGEGGRNLQRASQWLANPRKRTSRQQRSLWLSSARSAVFNLACAARVKEGTWQQPMPGEPLILAGTKSFFVPDDETDTDPVEVGDDASSAEGLSSIEDLSVEEGLSSEVGLSSDEGPTKFLQTDKVAFAKGDRQSTAQRVEQFDVHPSAPWWGRGRTAAQGECAEFEQAALKPLAAFLQGLERAGLEQERRAIRAIAFDLTTTWLEDNVLQLKFSLSPGVFATTLIREIATVTEPAR